MAKKLAYERYYWFHGQIRAGQNPNARKMAEAFEISQKQAQRDIEFMRDRLHVPLVYQSASVGYAYQERGYDLPPVWLQEEELLALSIALRLSAAIMPEPLPSIRNYIRRHFGLIAGKDSIEVCLRFTPEVSG